MTSKRTIQARARRGAAFLDERLGRGWRRRINRSRLDMGAGSYHRGDRDSCGCILAQLDATTANGGDGSFWLKVAELIGGGVPDTRFVGLGFLADHAGDYEPLTEAWKQELSRVAS